jgi:hypothetical protein
MLNFLTRISQSLGLAQNAERFRTQLADDLNAQSDLLQRKISGSAKLVALGLASAIIGIFALAVTIVLAYQLLFPLAGSAGSLAIVAGVLGLSACVLIYVMLKMSKNIPKLKRITIPPIYVPVKPVGESTTRTHSRHDGISNLNDASPTSTQLSDFLMREFKNQINRSSLDNSIKNFATSFAGNSNQIGKDVIQSLEEQLAAPGTTKKYTILAAAMATGFLMSRRP